MSGSRHAAPLLVREGVSPFPLTRIQLGGAEHAGDEREAFVQNLVHQHPEVIPMAEIEPAFMPLISVCRELQTEVGPIDNLWITPQGGLVLGECKLFRNPQARREVIAQALDYSRAMAKLHYDQLETAVRAASRSPSLTLWSIVRDRTDLTESQFVDAVERRLRQSRFMILIIGDGIQEGVEALTSHLQLHAGLHVGLALVDLSIWSDPDGRLLIVPRIPLRTVLVERGIVTVNDSGVARVLPPAGANEAQSVGGPRQMTLSETEFFDQLDQRRPGLSAMVRPFLDQIADMGIVPQFARSLNLRWELSAAHSGSAGYIDAGGKLWCDPAWTTANRQGRAEVGEAYLAEIAAIIGGSVRRYEKAPPDVVGPDGRVADAAAVLASPERWRTALTKLIEQTAPES